MKLNVSTTGKNVRIHFLLHGTTPLQIITFKLTIPNTAVITLKLNSISIKCCLRNPDTVICGQRVFHPQFLSYLTLAPLSIFINLVGYDSSVHHRSEGAHQVSKGHIMRNKTSNDLLRDSIFCSVLPL